MIEINSTTKDLLSPHHSPRFSHVLWFLIKIMSRFIDLLDTIWTANNFISTLLEFISRFYSIEQSKITSCIGITDCILSYMLFAKLSLTSTSALAEAELVIVLQILQILQTL